MFNKTLAILGLMLGIAACSVNPATTADNVFITDTHAAAVTFRSLRVEGQRTVKGQIHLTGRNPVHFGHVDYAVLDANGKVREQGWVEHSSAIRLRHANWPSLFTINLKQPLADGERVQLVYHTGTHS
jgi:hypothetical protein